MPSSALTRRALIAGAGTTIASAALAVPYVNAAHFSSTGTPSQIAVEYEDLTRYYAFLWSEFQALGDELGVGQHCSRTAHRNGDIDALEAALVAPPSTRAMSVLSSLGVTRDELPSQTHPIQKSRPDNDEIARTKLRRAAGDIRAAMALLGHTDFMVFVKDAPGLSMAKVINFEAGGETYAFA